MAKSVRQETVRVRQLLIDSVKDHPSDLVNHVAKATRLTRQAIYRHVNGLITSGVLEATGKTHARRYWLKPLATLDRSYALANLEEHVPWEHDIRPLIDNVPPNVLLVCNYAFTEMLNNAIDHSESESVRVRLTYTAESIAVDIHDHGVGIFRKVQRSIGLEHEHEAILELAKGKFTTDPTRHTGEGIFFTSRMVDLFSISSGSLYFTHVRPNEDWLSGISNQDPPIVEGTLVSFTVSLRSRLSPKDVFEAYSGEADVTFSKTHVPVRLAQFGSDNLVSRSQARRVLARVNRFQEVALDFAGVNFIGQGFADEIFRVYQQAHPQVKIVSINANPEVRGMILRASNVPQ